MRLFLLYVVLEIAVIAVLTATIGFGWTLLLLVGAFGAGLVLAGSQLRRQLRRLRSGLSADAVRGAATDSLLVAAGTVLVVVPGLASSVLGVLLLLPPTRAAARPVITAVAARSIAKHAPVITVAGYRPGRGSYIDGEVIDGEVIDTVDVDPNRLPRRTD